MINYFAVMTRLVPLMATTHDEAQDEADIFQEKMAKHGFNIAVFGFEGDDDSPQSNLDFDAGI